MFFFFLFQIHYYGPQVCNKENTTTTTTLDKIPKHINIQPQKHHSYGLRQFWENKEM